MTVEIPTPSADLIAQIENATIETSENETAAIAAIRTRFAPYAKHNGFIRIAYSRVGNSNYSREDELYYEDGGKKVRALLVLDEFDSRNHSGDQNRGEYTGYRLYLTSGGEWVKIKRTGNWSRWQGEGEGWGCGVSAGSDTGDEYDEAPVGYVKTLTDEQVARFEVGKILDRLGKSMADMCAKLPERYGKLKARAELARRIVEALK
jgi:hypothetical protein